MSYVHFQICGGPVQNLRRSVAGFLPRRLGLPTRSTADYWIIAMSMQRVTFTTFWPITTRDCHVPAGLKHDAYVNSALKNENTILRNVDKLLPFRCGANIQKKKTYISCIYIGLRRSAFLMSKWSQWMDLRRFHHDGRHRTHSKTAKQFNMCRRVSLVSPGEKCLLFSNVFTFVFRKCWKFNTE